MAKKARTTDAKSHAAAPKLSAEERRAEKQRRHEENAARHRELTAKHTAEILPPLPPFIEKLSECTDDLLLTILEAVSAGELFSRVCHEYGIKTTKVTAYINRSPETKTLWDTARRAQSEAWSDKLIELAQSATPEDVQVIRNEIDVRKWIMGKNNIRFAERTTVTHEGNPDKPISHNITSKMSDTEAASEYAEFRRKMSLRLVKQ